MEDATWERSHFTLMLGYVQPGRSGHQGRDVIIDEGGTSAGYGNNGRVSARVLGRPPFVDINSVGVE